MFTQRCLISAFRTFSCAVFLIWMPSASQADENAALWDALKGGDHFVLIRHALAPGFGDPGTVDLHDCNTQRNLSDEGREQARTMGDLFRSNGISQGKVYTSQWCRCRETAKLMGLGEVKDMPSLNSFFQRRENQSRQLRDFNDWLKTADLSKPTVLVTHQVMISALTDFFPSSGEIVFIRRTPANQLRMIGSIDTL